MHVYCYLLYCFLFKDEDFPLCEEPPRKRACGAEKNNDTNDDDAKSSNIKRTLTSDSKLDKVDVVTAKPCKQTPGHTGYLTFAVLYNQ